jgi:ribonuclease-3
MQEPLERERVLQLENFKASLQQLAQAKGLPHPVYVMVGTAGPDHAKTFTVEAQIGGQWREQGCGGTKKAASQMAARQLLERLQNSA